MTTARVRLAELITSFFTNRLAAELDASPHTILSYRDAFRLLLRYVAESKGRPASSLTLEDLASDAILAFLASLEEQRDNTVATRNARLAAIRSFFAYVITQEPAAAASAQKVLAIPFKKAPGRILDYLTEGEVRAILSGPDRSTARGRRDYLILALLYDTAARVQELLDLAPIDFRLDRLPLVRVTGKGRKQRVVPLLPATANLVRQHLRETNRLSTDQDPLLRNYREEKMTRSGISFLIDKYRRLVAEQTPTLRKRRVNPHLFRHTKAMHLLQAGVSPVTIKDILGHAHLKTLELYVEADLEMKRQALESATSPVDVGLPLHQHEPDLLQWLEQL